MAKFLSYGRILPLALCVVNDIIPPKKPDIRDERRALELSTWPGSDLGHFLPRQFAEGAAELPPKRTHKLKLRHCQQ